MAGQPEHANSALTAVHVATKHSHRHPAPLPAFRRARACARMLIICAPAQDHRPIRQPLPLPHPTTPRRPLLHCRYALPPSLPCFLPSSLLSSLTRSFPSPPLPSPLPPIPRSLAPSPPSLPPFLLPSCHTEILKYAYPRADCRSSQPRFFWDGDTTPRTRAWDWHVFHGT